MYIYSGSARRCCFTGSEGNVIGMSRKPLRANGVVPLSKNRRSNLSGPGTRANWELSRGRNDLTVDKLLAKAIEEEARQKRWNASQKRLAERFAEALIFGNGRTPNGMDRELRITVERAFAKICVDLGLTKGTLPGQSNQWYDNHVKTIHAGRKPPSK